MLLSALYVEIVCLDYMILIVCFYLFCVCCLYSLYRCIVVLYDCWIVALSRTYGGIEVKIGGSLSPTLQLILPHALVLLQVSMILVVVQWLYEIVGTYFPPLHASL